MLAHRKHAIVSALTTLLLVAACTAPTAPSVTPAVVSVTIDDGARSVVAGSTLALTASVETEGGAIEAVLWSSDEPSIATVSSAGVVTGVTAGEARVTAKSAFDVSKSDTVTVTVTPPPATPDVLSVAIDAGERSVLVGETLQLAATVATVGGASEAVTWTSNRSGTATVNSTGLVSGVAAGEALITATSAFDASLRDSTLISVVSVPPGAPARISVVTGDNQTAQAGSAVPIPPAVRVRDADENPLSGISVTFTVTAGNGAVAPATPVTSNADGIATLSSWVLGNTAGTNGVRAAVTGSSPAISATFSATGVPGPASPATSTVTANPTSLLADGMATATVRVRAKDAYGNELPTGGDLVQIDPPGLGTIGPVVDHGDGTYSATFTAGRTSGTVTFSARMNGAAVADVAALVLAPWTFGESRAIAATIGPADYYNRHWVAVDGNTALVPVADDPRTTLYTHVDVYERDDAGRWAWSASLVPFDGSGGMTYTDVGRLVQLSGDTAAVASVRNGVESVVHVFEREAAGVWRERAVLLRGEGVGTAVSYSAGIAIALRDDVLIVGRPAGFLGPDLPVRVYLRDQGGAGVWGLAADLPMLASAPDYMYGFLGTDVAVGAGGDVIAVAKSVQNNDGGLSGGEAAYVYERRAPGSNEWDLVRTLRYPDELTSPYSTYIEVDGSTLMVAHMPTIASGNVTVEFYERDAGGVGAWGRVAQREARLVPQAGWIVYLAHTSVRLVGDTAALGFVAFGCEYVGPGEEPPVTGCGAGQVHVYGRDVGGAGAWGEFQVLRPPVPSEGQRFGTAIDIAADEATVLVATSPAGRVPGEADVFVFER